VRPGAALVTSGPYRLLNHPNYLIVIGELAILPLAFNAPVIAAGFSVGNAVVLLRRVRLERAALGSTTNVRAPPFLTLV
jgi:methyltransferase